MYVCVWRCVCVYVQTEYELLNLRALKISVFVEKSYLWMYDG